MCLLATGINCLAVVYVSGWSRFPRPPAKIKGFQ